MEDNLLLGHINGIDESGVDSDRKGAQVYAEIACKDEMNGYS